MISPDAIPEVMRELIFFEASKTAGKWRPIIYELDIDGNLYPLFDSEITNDCLRIELWVVEAEQYIFIFRDNINSKWSKVFLGESDHKIEIASLKHLFDIVYLRESNNVGSESKVHPLLREKESEFRRKCIGES